MKTFTLTATLGAACLGVAACEVNTGDTVTDNEAAAAANEVATTVGGTEGTTTTTDVFVPGTRIIEEDGVFFRIDPGGARVRLAPEDSRILVVDGVRYRVDPGGNRVRIDETGAEISIPINDDVAVEVNTTQ